MEPTADAGNQLLWGGLILMGTGAVMAMLRGIPAMLWRWMKRQSLVTLDITDDEPAFHWFLLWLDQHPYNKKSRLLSISGFEQSEEKDEFSGRVLFSPAPGNHLLFYRGRPVWLHRLREKTEGGWGRRHTETINIQLLGRSQELARRLVYDAVNCARQAYASKLRVFVSYSGYWKKLFGIVPRRMESIILPTGHQERLLADIHKFLDSKDLYTNLGIPYRRGYLLHGIPGTGKTSLVSAISSEFKMPLYILNLGDSHMSDERLFSLVGGIEQESILLIEDVDAVVAQRPSKKDGEEVEEGGGATLSAVLNCLDGVLARDGCLIFLTTNHREKLDPALIRPGRVDYQLSFEHATEEQVERLHLRFFPQGGNGAAAFVQSFNGSEVTMADVQGRLLEMRGMSG